MVIAGPLSLSRVGTRSFPGGVGMSRGVDMSNGWVCPEGLCTGVGMGPPEGLSTPFPPSSELGPGILRDTIDKRVIRILL